MELVFQHLLLPEGVSPQEKGICRTGKTIDTLPLPNPEGINIRKWGGSEERGKQYSIPLLPLMIPKPQDQPELRGRKVGVRHLQLGVFQAFFVCFCFLKFYQLIIWGFILVFFLEILSLSVVFVSQSSLPLYSEQDVIPQFLLFSGRILFTLTFLFIKIEV